MSLSDGTSGISKGKLPVPLLVTSCHLGVMACIVLANNANFQYDRFWSGR